MTHPGHREGPQRSEGAPERAPQVASMRATLSWQLPKAAGGYTLMGNSRAADATAFVLPELGWCVDAGDVVKNLRPRELFLTHTHSDHIHVLPRMKSRTTCPNIYAPAHALELIEDFLQAAQELSINHRLRADESWEPAYRLVGVEPGDVLKIRRGKERFVVEVVGTTHTVPSVGYVMCEERMKLKPEFARVPGVDLGALRAKGIEISAPVRTPYIAFLGDTTPKVFADHPEVLRAPVVVTECSFLAPEHLENAHRTQHTHWSELVEVVRAHPEVTFVLTHFSWRYEPADIARVVRESALENVVVWMDLDEEIPHTMGSG